MTTSIKQDLSIQLIGVSKQFGRTRVLHRVDLEVPRGQVFIILGPNGSGKTTLIRTIAALTRPDEGTVYVAGRDVSKMSHQTRRLIGMVSHQPMLYSNLTVYENLRFTGRMFGLDNLDDRIKLAVSPLGMESNLHQRASTLSHGMRKRLSIARALLHNPPILLMDEPESGLDPEALMMLDSLVQEWAMSSRTVVMTTHNLDRARSLGHQLAILWDGEISYLSAADISSDGSSLHKAYSRHTGSV